MGILKDTAIHGLLDVFEGIYITEQKKNFATVTNGILTISDPAYSTTIKGINITAEGSKTITVNSTGDSVVIHAKRHITESTDIGNYTCEISGDITEISSTGDKVSRIYGDIQEITETGDKTTEIRGDIYEASSDGGKNTTVKTGIAQNITNGKYSVTAETGITETATNGPVNLSGDTVAINANNSEIHMKSSTCIYLDAPKLRLGGYGIIYGTEDPRSLNIPNPEEGLLYFRLMN